ncbi:hypothetical protein BDV29DRAFT_32112 [Aspergillus leporis]|uniref:Endo-1,3(4)-beta-glucanase n=1 Tax=Aspergillus leporis TaxID=41062 RepID=A0A5N5XB07_9EURO|nr:hypothetical protein BDV29DRAFT_32112 [Aspergillus leporis]
MPLPNTPDNPPPTGPDETSPQTRYHSLTINRDLIASPDPFTLYFGFFGSWNYTHKVQSNILRRVENARVLIQRLPTQPELDAMVTHSSRSLYQERIGAPIGFFAGAAQLYVQARKSEQFTRYWPTPTGSSTEGGKGQMPSVGQILEAAKTFAAAEPAVARRAVFVTGFKLLFWSVAGATMTSVWAVYNETKNTMADERLKQFLADLKRQKPEEVRQRQMESRGRRAVGEQAGDVVVEADRGDYGSGYPGDGNGQSSDGSVAERRPVLEPVGGSGVEQSRGGNFFDDDDASPTAPEYRTNRNLQASYQQGSAWERIRQQNASSGAVQSSRLDTSGQQSPQWDSWSSPSSESDKQREREQARAEFERLLDAERNVTQSSESDGRNKGWGKWN